MRKTLIAVVVVLVIAGLWSPKPGAAQSSYEKGLMAGDQAKAGAIASKIGAIEVLGPLAPVALSPFFGIACLSGTSILCSKGILPENDFLMGNSALNNGLVFVVFLLLAVATSVPKMTAVSKGFAEAADQLETYAGIITYMVILYLGSSGQESTASQVVYKAGIISFSRDTLLMAAAAVNIIVINTVKYFFELLVLISPIPALDAVFEAANKAVATALAAVYAFSPYLAMLLNIVLFLICLSIFNWARRTIKYVRTMYLDPVVAKILGRTDFSPKAAVRTRISSATGQQAILKVFPARKTGRIKKKELCYLTTGTGGLLLVKPRLIRRPKVQKLETANARIEISTGLVTNTIELDTGDGKRPLRLLFSRVHNSSIPDIAAALEPYGRVLTTAEGAKMQAAAPPEPAAG